MVAEFLRPEVYWCEVMKVFIVYWERAVENLRNVIKSPGSESEIIGRGRGELPCISFNNHYTFTTQFNHPPPLTFYWSIFP